MQRQISELLIHLKESPNTLLQLGWLSGDIQKITIDFVEDFSSEISEPMLILIRIVDYEVGNQKDPVIISPQF